MNRWISIKESKPITYRAGSWDGKISDLVLVVFSDLTFGLAEFNDGFMDGSKFENWYDDHGFEIEKEINYWMKLPEYP